jgi:hypothetical protein
MRKRNVLVAVLGIAAVLVAGGLFASNMGFKLNYTLLGTGSSASGTNTLGLPFFRQVGLDNAKQLIDDIEQGNTAAVTNVQRFLPATDSVETYAGTSGTAFNLAAGEGYFVKAGASNVSYIIVGSHDPGAVITLLGTGSSASGTNLYSYPYHSTAADAKQLIDDVEQGNTALVTNVQRFLPATDSVETYAGTSGTAFPLTPGQAYYIKLGTANVDYTPSHY